MYPKLKNADAPPSRRRSLVQLAALPLALLSAACVADQRRASDQPAGAMLLQASLLQASMDPVERDVPLPRGFKLVEQSSDDWSSGAVRYLRHRYRGGSSPAAVRGFYTRQMPLTRWTPVLDSFSKGRRMMQFERGPEICIVTISSRSRLLARDTIVDVVIGPKQR